MQETDTATRRLALPLEIKADGETGTFEGYGAIFGNRDKDGDIVARGAFAASLKGAKPALLWQHDQKSPIGRFDEVREDDKGLYVKGRLAMHGRGLEAYELLKMGALNGLSIGFVTKEASRDPATRTRTITEADLLEISLVTFPANELARVSTVKAAFSENEEPHMLEKSAHTARSFERLLRDNGFSRREAKAITAKGFKAADYTDSESIEIVEMITELKARQGVLEEKSTFGNLKKLTPAGLAYGLLQVLRKIKREEVNQVSVMPGRSASGRIMPVSPGEVSFEVTPPSDMRDAEFECSIKYYEILNGGRVRPATLNLDQTRTRDTVDRGILTALVPSMKLRDVEDYFKDIALNLTMGTTVATINLKRFPKGHPKRIKETRGVFKVRAINHAVEKMKIERAIEQYRRKHPEQFD